MILILIAAAVISFIVACMEGEVKEFFEPALILLIVILNAVIGVMQESKAEKVLVPGDIIKLEAGDFVPADARLIRSVSLKSELGLILVPLLVMEFHKLIVALIKNS